MDELLLWHTRQAKRRGKGTLQRSDSGQEPAVHVSTVCGSIQAFPQTAQAECKFRAHNGPRPEENRGVKDGWPEPYCGAGRLCGSNPPERHEAKKISVRKS
eukprot:scaffold85348_cov35-Tisochrysis_lutea.AAC.2